MITRKTSNGSILTLIQGDYEGEGTYHVLVVCKSNGSRGIQAYNAKSKKEAMALVKEIAPSYEALEAKRVS